MTLIEGSNDTIYADEDERIFKEPIGPVMSNDALPLIEKEILETARFAMYKPDKYLQRRDDLFDQLMREWSDGQITIPFDPHETSVEEALNAFLDERIEKKMAAFIEIGDIDETETIRVQADALEVISGHLAEQRDGRKKEKGLRSEQFLGILRARLILRDIIPAEVLDQIDVLMGVDKVLHKPTIAPAEVEVPRETPPQATHPMPEGFLSDTGTVKIPDDDGSVLADGRRRVAA